MSEIGEMEEEAPAAEIVAVAGGGADEPAADELPPLPTVLEAVLFAAAEPIATGRLVRLLAAWSRPEVLAALEELAAELEAAGRGIRLVTTANGHQLRSAPEAAGWIRRFFTDKPPRLSRPLLETLAIIAYRQPATRGEIEAIRGVNCDAVLGALVARNLVRIVGRRQSPGRPVEYGTTEDFLDLFSLRNLSELPPLPDPAALANLVESVGVAEGEEGAEGDGTEDGEAAEVAEPGGDRLAADGGGPDPLGAGAGEREDGRGTGDEG